MSPVIRILVAAAAVVFFVWVLLAGNWSTRENAPIDPNDPRQLGTLIGLMGGGVASAAIAQFALQRFEKEHGRKATIRDMATVAGMMRTMR